MSITDSGLESLPEFPIPPTIRDLMMHVRDLLITLGDEIRQANSNVRPGGSSSLTVEDMSKGPPKITSKNYVGSPLSYDEIDAALDAHGYAHRRAVELAMAGWPETLAALGAAKAGAGVSD